MGMQREEKPMGDTEVLIQQSLKYGNLIYEYFTLVSKTRLTETQAESLEKILQKAQFDPWLDFLIDEADHILGHQLNLINTKFISQQQNELKKSLDREWCKDVLQQIQEIQRQNHSPKMPNYLEYQDLQEVDRNRQSGSFTQISIELLRNKCQSDVEKCDCFDPKTGLVC